MYNNLFSLSKSNNLDHNVVNSNNNNNNLFHNQMIPCQKVQNKFNFKIKIKIKIKKK